MRSKNCYWGKKGERYACLWLHSLGFKIVATNYYCPWGEIDIIACKESCLHFVEVKTRLRNKFELFDHALTKGKIKAFQKSVASYLTHNFTQPPLISGDVLFIQLQPTGMVESLYYYVSAL